MKLKIIFILSSIVFCNFMSNAQDFAIAHKAAAVYTQAHLNPYLTNPAHTGFEDRGMYYLIIETYGLVFQVLQNH